MTQYRYPQRKKDINMKKQNNVRTQRIIGTLLLGVTLAAPLAAQTKDVVVEPGQTVPYLIDSRNVLVRSGAGLCWRTGSWSLDAARTTKVVGSPFPVGCECEKSLMPKEVCEPKPAPAAAPAPAPAPAPAAAPAPAPVPVAQKVTIPADALFEFDKAVITPAGTQALDDFVAQVKGVQLEVVLARGHADRIGSDAYNQTLSEKRANAVKDFLVSRGIDANRVYVEGKGESEPKTTDCTKLGAENGRNRKLVECLAPDRRVELEAVGTRQ